jgi:hypothetical protein
MQCRVTLSENDPIESRICGEARPLNSRRRGEYLRRLLHRGFMAEREDMAKLGAFPPSDLSRNVDSPHDYNQENDRRESTARGAGVDEALDATSITGIFANQARPDEATKRGDK